MYHFEALDDVISTRDRLSQRESPLAAILPRQPGTKESRYSHLLSDEPQGVYVPRVAGVDAGDSPAHLAMNPASSTTDRLAHLEEEVACLRLELSEVQQQLASFRKQFE
jgi:uncharacterized protein